MRRRTKPGSSIGRLAAQQIGCRDARWAPDASGPKEWEASGFNGGRFSCPCRTRVCLTARPAALQGRSWQRPPMNPHRLPRSICSAASPSSFVNTVARHQKPSRPLPSYWELNLIQAFLTSSLAAEATVPAPATDHRTWSAPNVRGLCGRLSLPHPE